MIAEIVLFAVSGRLPLGPIALLCSAAWGRVRWGAMAFDPRPLWLPLLQCLHGLSFGATHLGAIAFMVRAAPAEIGATAQGYLAVAQGLVMAAAMGLAGLLYGARRQVAYAAMALMGAAGAASAFAASRFAQPPARQAVDDRETTRNARRRRTTGRSGTSWRVRDRSGRSSGATARRSLIQSPHVFGIDVHQELSGRVNSSPADLWPGFQAHESRAAPAS